MDKKAPAVSTEALKKINSIISQMNLPSKDLLQLSITFAVRDFIKARGVI